MAVPNLWRTKRERYSLQGQVCAECSQSVFPPRMVCPNCHQPMGSFTCQLALAHATANKAAHNEFLFTMPLPVPAELKVAADD